MNLFAIKQVDLWGDYGDVLISGYYRREAPEGPALLQRSGPFLPPISFPYSAREDIVVVSQTLRSEIESSGIAHAGFRETTFEKVIPIEWHTWNRTARHPKRRPPGGEPENYLLGQKHSAQAARDMEPAWELIPHTFPFVFGRWLGDETEELAIGQHRLLVDNSDCRGFCRCSLGGPAIVDDATRAWLQARVPGWVSFDPLTVVLDPSAAQRLETLRRRNALRGPHLTPAEYRARAIALCEKHSYVIPPAFNRPDLTVSRYCVVLSDQTPARLSAATYDSYAAIAAYVEHRYRVHAGPNSALPGLLIYDLETGRRLSYLGSNEFREVGGKF